MKKKTKFLWDDAKHTSAGMVSVSQLQTFMSCPKKWEYGYVEEITPRIERPYLSVGKLCHKGMQEAMRYKWEHERELGYCRERALNVALVAMLMEWEDYMDSVPILPEERSDFDKILSDASSVFQQAFWELDIDKYEVMSLWDGKREIPALELHFVVPCGSSKGLHGYIDAILKDKTTGFTWCTDYKFRKSLSPDEEEATNIQNAVYIHACGKMGIPVTGTMTWQHLNTPAAEPQLIKGGMAVSRAKIKTTWKHYADFCLKHDIDPTPYQEEMEAKLADIEWYRATYEYRNDETIRNMWTQVILPATRQVKAAYTKTNSRHLYPWNCKTCQFKDLCQAELRGYDAEAIRQRDFVKRNHTNTDKRPVDTQ